MDHNLERLRLGSTNHIHHLPNVSPVTTVLYGVKSNGLLDLRHDAAGSCCGCKAFEIIDPVSDNVEVQDGQGQQKADSDP